MGKTNAEMCRSYYYRKKAAKAAEKQQGMPAIKTVSKKKTGAERTRAWRLRKKMLTQGNQSSEKQSSVISTISNSRIMNSELSPQPVTSSTNLNRLDVAMVSSNITDPVGDNVCNLFLSNVVFDMGKTNAEMCKNYYRQGLSAKKSVPIRKTGAERTRAWRLRKKMLAQRNQSSGNEILANLSTSNSRKMNSEASSQPVTSGTSLNYIDVAMVSSSVADRDDKNLHNSFLSTIRHNSRNSVIVKTEVDMENSPVPCNHCAIPKNILSTEMESRKPRTRKNIQHLADASNIQRKARQAANTSALLLSHFRDGNMDSSLTDYGSNVGDLFENKFPIKKERSPDIIKAGTSNLITNQDTNSNFFDNTIVKSEITVFDEIIKSEHITIKEEEGNTYETLRVKDNENSENIREFAFIPDEPENLRKYVFFT